MYRGGGGVDNDSGGYITFRLFFLFFIFQFLFFLFFCHGVVMLNCVGI